MKNIILTGATGFLGRNMVKCLCGHGYTVYAVVRPDSRNTGCLPLCDGLKIVYSPLDGLSQHMDEFPRECSAFYHFAWGGVNRSEINDEEIQNNNAALSEKVLGFAADIGCKVFIQAGSRSEYGLIDGKYSEDMECAPVVAYGRAKLRFSRFASGFCAANGIQYINPRIFSVYGYDDHPWSLIYTAVNKMLKNEPMDLSLCTQSWNFMDVRDACDLMLTFYEKHHLIPPDDNGIFNVATDDIRPLREFINEIRTITHSSSRLNFGAFRQTADSTYSVIPDMTKTYAVFDWRPKVTFDEGIRYMITKLGE